jgi:hypothetical protein
MPRPSLPASALAILIGAAGLFLVVAVGCPEASVSSADEGRLRDLLADSAHVVGGQDWRSPDGVLALSLDARFLGADAVIVSDIAPPYLRVFGPGGRLIATALERGRGPQEATRVYGIAVSEDSVVLTLTDSGLRRYVFADHTLRFADSAPRTASAGPVQIGSTCGRGWAVYAPPRSTRGVPDAHILLFGNTQSGMPTEWTPALPWQVDPPGPAYGKRYHMLHDSSDVYIRHEYAPGKPILAVPCEGGSARVVRMTEEIREGSQGQPNFSERGMALTLPAVSHSGFAVESGVLIEAALHRDLQSTDRPIPTVTVFTVHRPEGPGEVTVPGDWSIHDWRPGRLLLYTTVPEPRLVALPTAALLDATSH